VAEVVDFLVGPTASGKTQVGVLVAEALGAEVISLDSMAVYRGMDIGTAKPSPEERARVPFHLIDVCEPTKEFSAGDYLRLAAEAIAEIEARGRRVLFVGGTPMYLRLLLEGVFRGPRADWEFRRALRARAQREGTAALHAELARVDPEAAQRLHPNDVRRIERALEVHHLTARPLSELQQENQQVVRGPKRLVGLRRARADLYRRIDERVEWMWAAGFVEEVRRLAARGFSRSASQALGYREVLRHLAGELTLAEARELTQRHTRQLAKRQMTWLRSIEGIRWVEVGPEDRPEDVAPQVLVALRGSRNAER
jgi:tRNA dimethylallyltransferase